MCRNAVTLITEHLKDSGKKFYLWTPFDLKRVRHTKLNWFIAQLQTLKRDPEIDVNEKRPWKWHLLTNDSSLGQRIEQQHSNGNTPSTSNCARLTSFSKSVASCSQHHKK